MNNQLRIGSIVGYKHDNELLPAKVTSIASGHITVEIIDNPYEDLSDHQYVENWHPIPMTPAWLEKFGFVSDIDRFKEKVFTREMSICGHLLVEDDYSVGIYPYRPDLSESWFAGYAYPYVHQFQNLIHALKNNYDA